MGKQSRGSSESAGSHEIPTLEAPLPPWLMYPDLPAGHIGWRMGAGEDYLSNWHDWLFGISQQERQSYLLMHCPIPGDWLLGVAEIFSWHNEEDDDVFAEAWMKLGGQELEG